MDKKIRRILVGLFLASLLLGSVIATQLIASQLGYPDELYWSIYDAGEYKIYNPIAWIFWWQSFGNDANDWFFNRYGFNAFSITVLLFTIMILFYRMWLLPKITDSHGSAHFATMQEIENTKEIDPPGLTAGKGVFLGVMPDGTYLRDDTKTHVLVCAPTRSGKGVGIIIPTLLTWEESVVVTDIKGENWALTSAWRKEKLGNKVLKFEPTSDFSSKYNPFDEIRIRTKYEVRDIQNIVKILVDPTGKGSEGNQAHWINNAGALLTAVILHLKYIKEHANMYDVLQFLYGERSAEKDAGLDDDASDYDEDDFDSDEADEDEEEEAPMILTLQERMEQLIVNEFEHDPTGKVFREIYGVESKMHPMVRQYFQSMVDKPDKEFGSILSTLDTVLNTYRDPIIAENMSHSDFRMTDMMENDSAVSLYLVFPPSDIDRVKPLFRVIVEMLYRKNTEPMEFKDGQKVDKKHRMLMLLDEFPALGKLETFETAMAYIAGYGIKAMIITQDINQIEKLYSTSNSIVSNCQVQVYHTPTDNKTPEFISKKMGNKTIQVKSTSVNGSLVNIGGRSYTLSETARPLMTADEVNTMDKKKELIFVSGVPPILADKIRYYEVPYFSRRTKKDAPDKTDVIRGPEAEKEKEEAL